MIDARELRLGNLVKRRTRDESLKVDLQLLTKISRNGVIYAPIILTEDWILKFGFTWYDDRHLIIQGMKIWVINGLFYCDKTGVRIDSVHWLQNYYFFKNGIELELK